MPPNPDAIDAFFDSYRRSFERFDAAAIADHFTFPAHLTADARDIDLTSITDRNSWIAQLERLLDMYRAIEVAYAQARRLSVTQVSPRLIQASVHWALHDRAGKRLYDFEAAYTLAEIGGAWRITAIAHNEIPHYRACLARLRAPRTEPGRSETDPPG